MQSCDCTDNDLGHYDVTSERVREVSLAAINDTRKDLHPMIAQRI